MNSKDTKLRTVCESVAEPFDYRDVYQAGRLRYASFLTEAAVQHLLPQQKYLRSVGYRSTRTLYSRTPKQT